MAVVGLGIIVLQIYVVYWVDREAKKQRRTAVKQRAPIRKMTKTVKCSPSKILGLSEGLWYDDD